MNFFTNVTEVSGNQFQSSFWFPQQIIYCKIGGFIDWKPDLLRRIADNQKKSSGVKKSNVGGWQSESLISDPKFSSFLQKITEVSNLAARQEFGLRPELSLKMTNAWANINLGTDSNGLHSHPWTHLASCLYLSIPEGSGTIRFTLDEVSSVINSIRTLENQVSLNSTPYTEIVPSEGLLLLFPGNLKHSVMPGTNQDSRISMAFNFCV